MTPSPCCVYCFYRSLNLASWKLLSALFIFAHRCPLSQPKTPASNFSDESMMGKPCALRVFSQTFLAVRGLGGTRHAITLEVGRFRSHSTFSLARMSFHCWLSLSLSQKQRAWRCCPECIKLFRSFLLLIPPFVFLQIAAAAGEMEVTVLPFADSEQRRYETVVYCTPICHRLLTLLPLLGKASLFKLPLCSLH